MGKSPKERMKMWFDEDEDILYISFAKGPAIDSEEKDDGIRVEYDRNRHIIGIEILEMSKRIVEPLARKITAAVCQTSTVSATTRQ